MPPAVVYTVFADYGGAYAWIKRMGDRSPGLGRNFAGTFGGMASTWGGEHPISATLELAFATWQRAFQATRDDEPLMGWPDFNRQGLDLAIRLKSEMGAGVEVRYAAQPRAAKDRPVQTV